MSFTAERRNGSGVRQERTGWRDLGLSERHRKWGFNCPAVDLDFLMVEYNVGLPAGLVEYKHHYAAMPDLRHPTYRALTALADMSKLPFMLAFYWPDIWAFQVFPVNAIAGQHIIRPFESLSEQEFVARLYTMRNRTLEGALRGQLRTERPPEAF